MTNDKELSNLKLERKECPKCGATWINGKACVQRHCCIIR